jgi:hypothetical protein
MTDDKLLAKLAVEDSDETVRAAAEQQLQNTTSPASPSAGADDPKDNP